MMTNRRNRFVYRLWAPFYDRFSDVLFASGRARAMAVLDPKPGEAVLLVGVGTGADLPFLPRGVRAVGVDLSPDMLARARAKLPLPGREVELLEGDAHDPPVPRGTFDAALLNLILSVVPDGARCLAATLDRLKPGGRAVVFDKFLPEGARPSLPRRIVGQGISWLGTDINRRFGDLAAGLPCEVVADEASLLHGAYRVILLRKTA